MKKSARPLRTALIVIGCLVLAVLIAALLYVWYVAAHYYRIADNTPLSVDNNQNATLQTDTAYHAVTWNTGFGAYDPAFTFFMDSGEMKDGTTVHGSRSTAQSLESVRENLSGQEQTLKALNPDLMLLQEVDEKATRSYNVNMRASFAAAFPEDASVFAENFHTVYLLYPLHDPHGSALAGLMTLSRDTIASAVRISYPVDTSGIEKFFDLDRCFSAARLPVDGGKTLVLINSHMSAYDKGGTVRAQQMKVLSDYLKKEAEAGNYVIVGGDFNQILTGAPDAFASDMKTPEWVYDFDKAALPEGFHVVDAENAADVPTIRSTDIPYTPGVSYTTIVDGFIVSGNVRAQAKNIQTDFKYSDHNPVELTFTLD